MWGKQAAGTKHLGVMCRREVQPWPEASSAGEGSLVSFWGPLGACQETVGLEDDTSGLPDMGAHLENPMQGGSTSPQNTHVQSSACTHRHRSTRTCTHRRGGTYTRARGHRHRHTCMQACAHVHTHLAVYTHTPQAVHVHGRTQYACTRGCTHMHTYAHTYTCTSGVTEGKHKAAVPRRQGSARVWGAQGGLLGRGGPSRPCREDQASQ